MVYVALAGCNPPEKIIAAGSLGKPVSVTGPLRIAIQQPDPKSVDTYAVAYAALETTSVVFCKNSSTSSCDGAKSYNLTFQKRDESGFYFITTEPLNFTDGTSLLFLSYISNNGDKPSQKGTATFYKGKIVSDESEELADDSLDSVNVESTSTTSQSNQNGGIDTSQLVSLFQQLLGGGSSNTSTSNTTTPTTTPVATTTPTTTTPTTTTPTSTTSQTDNLVPNPNNIPLSASEFEVIRLTNAERQRQGKPALIVQQSIITTARESSRLMKQQNNMVHGLTSGWNGENIAMGYPDPAQVVQGWINSPGHYRNMMGTFKYIGVGDTKDQSGTVYWTQQFNY